MNKAVLPQKRPLTAATNTAVSVGAGTHREPAKTNLKHITANRLMGDRMYLRVKNDARKVLRVFSRMRYYPPMLVWDFILDEVGEHGGLIISTNDMAKEMDYSVSRVRKGIRLLEACNLIQYKINRRLGNSVHLNPQAVSCFDEPSQLAASGYYAEDPEERMRRLEPADLTPAMAVALLEEYAPRYEECRYKRPSSRTVRVSGTAAASSHF